MWWRIGAGRSRDNSAGRWWTPVLSGIERLVAAPDGGLEPLLGGEALEVEALGRVTGDSVEDGAEDLGGVQPLCVHGLVHQQLHHGELVDRHAGDALHERLEALVELR